MVPLRTYMMVSMCFLKEEAWQFVMCLFLVQALATVPLWRIAPRILGRLDPRRIQRTLASWKLELVLLLGSWESLFTSEPFSGGLELFLEAKRIQVGRRGGKLLCGPEL